jgi:succinate dehydrogenase / fumarate reductase iron-sulfur subunit
MDRTRALEPRGGRRVNTVTLRIRRSEPGQTTTRWQSFAVPLEDRTTVLDALFFVQREHDRALAFRCACRAAMCGSCAMVINGSERLACKTALASLPRTRPVRVEPLRNLPVLKDLVVDLDPLFEKYAGVAPWLTTELREPAVIPASDVTRMQIGEGLDCISCGACYSACPMVAVDPEYVGPMQLLRAFNVLADTREHPTAADMRGEDVYSRHGVWRCHGIGECTRVCPKGLDPSLAIRRLKRSALVRGFS